MILKKPFQDERPCGYDYAAPRKCQKTCIPTSHKSNTASNITECRKQSFDSGYKSFEWSETAKECLQNSQCLPTPTLLPTSSHPIPHIYSLACLALQTPHTCKRLNPPLVETYFCSRCACPEGYKYYRGRMEGFTSSRMVHVPWDYKYKSNHTSIENCHQLCEAFIQCTVKKSFFNWIKV